MRADPSNLASAGMKVFPGRSGLSGGAIAGIVIGVLLCVGIIVAIVAFVFIKRPELPVLKKSATASNAQGVDNNASTVNQKV